MATTSDHDHQAPTEEPEPEEPLPVFQAAECETVGDAPELEATELEQLRRNYTRASKSTTISKKPSNPLQRFTYAIAKFWRHQVSVTVPHESCRDHLGMAHPDSWLLSYTISPRINSQERFYCTPSPGTVAIAFHNPYKLRRLVAYCVKQL
jgi:hypothetical protein